MSMLQIILIVVIFLVVAGIGILFVNNQEAERKKKQAALIKGASAHKSGGPVDEKTRQNKRRADLAKKLKDAKDEEDAKKAKPGLKQKIAQAGWTMSIQKFWIFSVISMVIVLLVAKVSGFSPFVMLMVGVIGLLGIPRFVLRQAIARRQKKFMEDFADALEATVRLLKAGMPVSEAVSMISKEFTGPVGEEMSIIYDKQKIGVPLHQAALESCARMPLTEMQMFATGLAIQAQTGSSLSEILTNLANVIRARFRLKRKIKALSSEAIASAGIIGALPILVTLGLWAVNPDYISLLFTDPFGRWLLTGAVVWMSMGILVMRQMINFKI